MVRLLHLNASQSALKQAGDDEHYKVLVLDTFTKAVIAPLLRVNELRKHGITLHLALETPRDPIPDTPSVYFVRGNEEGVRRIVADAAAGLYDSFHLNFTPSLPAPLMEQLAAGMLLARGVQIHQNDCPDTLPGSAASRCAACVIPVIIFLNLPIYTADTAKHLPQGCCVQTARSG